MISIEEVEIDIEQPQSSFMKACNNLGKRIFQRLTYSGAVFKMPYFHLNIGPCMSLNLAYHTIEPMTFLLESLPFGGSSLMIQNVNSPFHSS